MEYYFIAQSQNYHLNNIFREIKSESMKENHHREPVVSGSPILILTHCQGSRCSNNGVREAQTN